MQYLNADGEIVEREAPFVRSDGNYDMRAAGRASALYCLDATRTQQQFKEEVDINTIVRRFGLTGELERPPNMPQSGDFTEAVTDYHTALNMVRRAEEEFYTLPGEMRARFRHDPQELIKFMENPANLDEAVKLGLVNPPEIIEAVPAAPAEGPVTT